MSSSLCIELPLYGCSPAISPANLPDRRGAPLRLAGESLGTLDTGSGGLKTSLLSVWWAQADRVGETMIPLRLEATGQLEPCTAKRVFSRSDLAVQYPTNSCIAARRWPGLAFSRLRRNLRPRRQSGLNRAIQSGEGAARRPKTSRGRPEAEVRSRKPPPAGSDLASCGLYGDKSLPDGG